MSLSQSTFTFLKERFVLLIQSCLPQNFTYKGILEGHTDAITSVSVVGNDLWSCSRDNTVRVWNTTDQTCTKVLENAGGGQAMCMILTQEPQVLCGGSDGRIRSLNTKVGAKPENTQTNPQTLDIKRTFAANHSREVACMHWDNTNGGLWVGSLDKKVSVWN